jgi:hypothetical protein
VAAAGSARPVSAAGGGTVNAPLRRHGWRRSDIAVAASVTYAPFHHLPTQYRITVDGEQKWFAQ